MYASDGVMTSAPLAAAIGNNHSVDPKLHVCPSTTSAPATATSPHSVIRFAPQRSAIRPQIGCTSAEATAPTPNTRPTRPGPTPNDWSCSASTGSSIECVADTPTTAIAQAATV